MPTTQRPDHCDSVADQMVSTAAPINSVTKGHNSAGCGQARPDSIIYSDAEPAMLISDARDKSDTLISDDIRYNADPLENNIDRRVAGSENVASSRNSSGTNNKNSYVEAIDSIGVLDHNSSSLFSDSLVRNASAPIQNTNAMTTEQQSQEDLSTELPTKINKQHPDWSAAIAKSLKENHSKRPVQIKSTDIVPQHVRTRSQGPLTFDVYNFLEC